LESKDIRFRKAEFVAKTQFLNFKKREKYRAEIIELEDYETKV